ncbi:hypothetical protein DFP72DRAFT_126596 [Ephemerocybe angulata]|uniref:Uncharacterized protein n=1 Tax=Ephemerocybe angulata TaxID=980116 RepID=A0A8H6HCV5_9AGAR|nr:hypothetical protein DFP72DRAFT_126596 [Tulosesus angulatus]
MLMSLPEIRIQLSSPHLNGHGHGLRDLHIVLPLASFSNPQCFLPLSHSDLPVGAPRSLEDEGGSQCSPLYQPMGTPPILHEDSRASIPPSRRSRSPSRSRTPPIVRYRREPFQLSRRTSPPARASTPDYADRRGPRRHSPAPSWVDYGDGELWQSDRSLSPLPVPPPRHRSTMPPQYPDVPSAPSPIVLPSSNSGRRSYRQASPSITHARRPRPSHYTSHHHHGHRDADSFDEKHSYKYPEVHSSTPYRPVPQPPFINPNQKQGGAEPMSSTSDTAEVTWIAIALSLFFDLVPRQVYLHLLLRFPALYFSRVTRIFRDANLGMGEIKKMALEAVLNQDDSENGAGKHMNQMLLYNGMFLQNPQDNAPMEYVNLRNSWQGFIDSLMREWKTLNIISVLLLSAILTILQIDAAAENPLTRFSALLSLVCAFMSLLYGCIYIIRFGTMRKTHKAAEWANESERSSTSIFWNVWVMLAMPAVWLAWSMIFYIITIMSFVWQTGPTISTTNPEPPTTYLSSDLEILVPRIIISVVFGLGLVYLALIAVTFRRYSDPMEEAWRERISGWLQEKATAAARMGYAGYQSQGRPPYPGPDEHARKQQQPPYYGEKSEVKVGGEGEKGHSGRAKNLTATAPVSKSKGLTATEKGFTKLDEIPPGVKGLAPFVSFTGVNVTNLPPVTAGREVGDVDPKGGEEKRTTEKPKFKRKGNPAPLVAPSPPRDSSLPRHSPPPLIPQPAPIQPESTIISNTYPVVPGVVAIPLKSRELSDDSRSEVHNKIEEMEEVIRLDSEGARARGRLANSTENIPIPRDLLAQGLQVASWYLLCEDIKRDWDAVVQSRPGSLRDLLKSIKKWNNTLITYNMFILLVQLDSKNVNPQPNSSESPTLTTSSVVQKGCAVYLGSSELQKVGVRRDDEDELRGTAGEGGDTPYRPVWYYALVESLAEVVAVDEDDGNGLLQFSEDENDGADRGGV